MSENDEQTLGTAVATFAGSAFKKRKKKKKKRKNPLALAKSGISTPVGFEDTTSGSMSAFAGHPPYSQKGRKKAQATQDGDPVPISETVMDAVDAVIERALQPGAGRKGRAGKEMKDFMKKKGLLGIPRQRMK